MTEYKQIHPSVRFIFSETQNHPAKILCDNETHQQPMGNDISAEMFPVLMHCQKWGFEKEQVYVHAYTGACPACGDNYIYSPDATPAQIEKIKHEMEKTR